MKKLFVAIFAVVLFTTVSFSQSNPHDNTGAKNATSIFKVDIWEALGVSTQAGPHLLGTYVISASEYTVADGDKLITFTISGQVGAAITCTTTGSSTVSGLNNITTLWTLPTALDAEGKATATVEVQKLFAGAVAAGVVFPQQLNVAYTMF